MRKPTRSINPLNALLKVVANLTQELSALRSIIKNTSANVNTSAPFRIATRGFLKKVISKPISAFILEKNPTFANMKVAKRVLQHKGILTTIS